MKRRRTRGLLFSACILVSLSAELVLGPTRAATITNAGASLVAESCSPGNNSIDPGETVSLSFSLQNTSGSATTDLIATLLSTNGVVSPGAPEDYGILVAGGLPVARTFSFTANRSCGDVIDPVLQLQDGTNNPGFVTFHFSIGLPSTLVAFSENFDGITAPDLPAGWTASTTVGTPWRTSTALSDTAPNAVFAADPASATDNRLTSPAIPIPSNNSVLTFRHRYVTEPCCDGGVLEISMDGGGFADILNAGGLFQSGGYNTVLSTNDSGPLGGRNAWAGNSGGFVTTVVNLPAAAAGKSIQLRWRFGSDGSLPGTGWYVDTASITFVHYDCCSSLVPPVIVDSRRLAPNAISFGYDSVATHTYFVEAADALASPNWTVLATNLADGTRQFFTNSTPGAPERYYRLHAQ